MLTHSVGHDTKCGSRMAGSNALQASKWQATHVTNFDWHAYSSEGHVQFASLFVFEDKRVDIRYSISTHAEPGCCRRLQKSKKQILMLLLSSRTIVTAGAERQQS